MATAELRFAYVDPDSMVPTDVLLMGFFVDGKRVSTGQARDAHRSGKRVETRRLARPNMPLRRG